MNTRKSTNSQKTTAPLHQLHHGAAWCSGAKINLHCTFAPHPYTGGAWCRLIEEIKGAARVFLQGEKMQKITNTAQFDAVVSCLESWADWMRGYSNRGGYPHKSAMLQSGYVSATFEDMCDEADGYRNLAVDSCVDDLPPDLRAAIYRKYLASVFRLRDFEGALLAGHAALVISLRKKGVVW